MTLQVLGRYVLYDEIAAGGMATVHLGRLVGDAGFSRTVAIKRLHTQFAKDPEFVAMFLDEAHLAARIRHSNVVATLDVEATPGELFLVMEYIAGESLARLLRLAQARDERVPLAVLVAIVTGALVGLHAAHEAQSETGEPLRLVHRDVSPHNILVGTDGIPRVLDFGIAKANDRLQQTRTGQVKGKVLYMAPEQLEDEEVDRRADIYGMGAVLWEGLTGRRLYEASNEAHLARLVTDGTILPPSQVADVPKAFDAVVMKALAKSPKDRFATAAELADALEKAMAPASPRQVGAWVSEVAEDVLKARAAQIDAIERSASVERTPRDALIAAVQSSGGTPRLVTAREAGLDASRSHKVSVTIAPELAPTLRARIAYWGAGAALVALLLAVSLRANRQHATQDALQASGNAQPAAPTPAPPPFVPRVTELPIPPARSDGAVVGPAKPHSSARAPAAPPSAAAAPSASAAASAPPPAPDVCASPYYIEDGIKKIRRECVP
nr:serine/threonine protein kinase [uncultured bacterium]